MIFFVKWPKINLFSWIFFLLVYVGDVFTSDVSSSAINTSKCTSDRVKPSDQFLNEGKAEGGASLPGDVRKK